MSRSSPALATKLGLFGGTFDPIHHGHLIIAEWIASELGLERVIFIPVAEHPFGKRERITPAFHRLEMVQRALDDFPHFVLSDVEIRRGGVSYTIDTLSYFKQTWPLAELYFFIGGDNLAEFHRWREYKTLLKMARFVVYDRPGGELPAHLPKEKFLFVKAPLIEISSSLIRQRIKTGLPCRSLLPPPVWRYIEEHQLYGYREAGDSGSRRARPE
ncbi:nicotinate-nucleotide adenylyltransferase [Caldithrix abyssi]